MMAQSTGPILAAGGIVIFNAVIIHRREPVSQTRVAVATLVTAVIASVAERALPRATVAGAWLVLATTLLVRVDERTPAPIESLNQFING